MRLFFFNDHEFIVVYTHMFLCLKDLLTADLTIGSEAAGQAIILRIHF